MKIRLRTLVKLLKLYFKMKNKNSKFLSLNWLDFLKGLAVAVISAVITALYDLIQVGLLADVSIQMILEVAVAALLAYLMKNLFTNSSAETFKRERR